MPTNADHHILPLRFLLAGREVTPAAAASAIAAIHAAEIRYRDNHVDTYFGTRTSSSLGDAFRRQYLAGFDTEEEPAVPLADIGRASRGPITFTKALAEDADAQFERNMRGIRDNLMAHIRTEIERENQKPADLQLYTSGRQNGKLRTTRAAILAELERLALEMLYGNAGAGKHILVSHYVGAIGLELCDAAPPYEAQQINHIFYRAGERSDPYPDWLTQKLGIGIPRLGDYVPSEWNDTWTGDPNRG